MKKKSHRNISTMLLGLLQKEAAFKAISWKIKDKYEVCWKDFEVVNDKQGRPKLNIIGIDLKRY